MSKSYCYGLVPMKPEIEKIDLINDDDCAIEIPKIHFEFHIDTDEEQSAHNWYLNSVFVSKDNCVVKYTEATASEILLEDEDGKTVWLNGKEAEIIGIDIEGFIDIRERKDYKIEMYDIDKSEKRRYKVILEETSNMNDYDYYTLENLLTEDNI